MSTLNNPIQDRPDGWSLSDEGYQKVTRIDFHGVEYEAWEKIDKRPDLGSLWSKWRSRQTWSSGGGNQDSKQNTLVEIEMQNPSI